VINKRKCASGQAYVESLITLPLFLVIIAGVIGLLELPPWDSPPYMTEGHK